MKTTVYLLRWGPAHEMEPMGIFTTETEANKQGKRLQRLTEHYDVSVEAYELNGTEFVDYEHVLQAIDRGERND